MYPRATGQSTNAGRNLPFPPAHPRLSSPVLPGLSYPRPGEGRATVWAPAAPRARKRIMIITVTAAAAAETGSAASATAIGCGLRWTLVTVWGGGHSADVRCW